MRYAIVLILVLSCAVFAQQTASLRGKVVQDKRPEGKAVVVLRSRSGPTVEFTVTADENGEFVFENIPSGDYTVSSGGRKNSGRAIGVGARESVRLSAGERLSVTLSLESRRVLATVTIAADDHQFTDEVSKSVDTIGGQEMRDRADITLVDSLRTIPGFRIQQLGGFGRTANIKSRGLRNQDTAVLIDGVRFRDAAAITGDASPYLSDFTLTSVSGVEVLRGPGSSLYGTNAVGGTIDFQTPTPSAGWHGQISGAVGGLGMGRFRGNVSYGTSDSKFGFITGVSRTVFTKGIDGNDEANNSNWQGRVDLKPTNSTSISGRFFFSDAFVRLNADPDTLGILPPSNSTIIDAIPNVNFIPDVDDPDKSQDSDFFNGQIVLNHAFSSGFDLQAYYSGLRTERTNKNGPLGPGFQSEGTNIFDGQIHTANTRFRWTNGSINTFSFGYEFEKEKFENEGSTPDGVGDFFTRAGQKSHSVYAQDLVSLHDGRLQFSGGFRAQFFSLDEPTFSESNAPYSDIVLENPPAAVTFDGSASYYFQKSGTKLRAHVGSGYRVPSLFERFGSFFNMFGGDPFIAAGDPFLEAEKSWAFDAGVDQNLLDRRARLSAVYFYSKLRRTIWFSNDAPPIGNTIRIFGGYVNTEGGQAKGVELSGKFEPTRSTDIFTSFTYTDSKQIEPQVSGSGVLTTLGIPKGQFTLVATQRFGKAWVNFDLLLTSSYLGNIFQSNFPFGSYVYRFKANRRGDLTAGYTFPFTNGRFNLRIFGTIENLFDNEYFENGFRTAGRNARIGANFSF